ncbi:hypothetical protein GRI58_13325 [Porphyrobacter algicida]|uniref:YCII-related domain-containing protein n=1 Tax=Qipengyuania algicida TaxID=1836209 RepID=A0A845AHR4_9SPHN|nr:YciI family protein [Qipengyuania algicida]MXP29790.1 hypothetical protein [Qipengyuania algicida]
MFVFSLHYLAPLDEIDALLPAHREWLAAQHEAGYFFAWGRKVPREGGMIFANASSRDEAERLANSDPFVVAGVACSEVIEFDPAFVAAGLEQLRG